jgi:ribbon-helix-helix CopG family protein
MAGGRARAGEYAERVNAAVDLAEVGVPAAEAIGVLAERFGCSARQARRYVERAARHGRIEVPQEMVAFTVKLPAELVDRVRARARASGQTISAVVAQALAEFLTRSMGKRRRR